MRNGWPADFNFDDESSTAGSVLQYGRGKKSQIPADNIRHTCVYAPFAMVFSLFVYCARTPVFVCPMWAERVH